VQSRLNQSAASYFELLVWLPGRGPLRQLFQADTVEAAVVLAEAAYGGCRVEVPPPVAAKPQLIRSSTSPSVARRARNRAVSKLPITLVEMSELIETTCKAPWVRVMEDQARYEYLEELYRKSGRDQVGHAMHSLYTGLYQEALSGVAVESVDVGEV
jgi:hypothetical protein